MIRLGGPSPSRTMPHLAVSRAKSMCRTPTSPPSSWREKATSTARCGLPDSATQARASSTMARPALQSPPRMVVPSERRVSPSSCGWMSRPGSTVSRWADRSKGSPTPSSRATMLLYESCSTDRPRDARRALTSLSMASSSPLGLSILMRSMSVSVRR